MTYPRQDPMKFLLDAIARIGGAECQQVPHIFFPEDNHKQPKITREENAAAKTICGRCPIQVECLTYALESGEAYGIWGGLLASER